MGSCSLFFVAALFYLGGRQHFSFSHSRYKIFVILQTKLVSFVFLSLVLALSLLSTPMQTLKLSRKKESASLFGSGWLCDLLPKRECNENAKFHPGLHEAVDVRTDDFLRTKFLGCIVQQIFLPMVLRCAPFARECSAIITVRGKLSQNWSLTERVPWYNSKQHRATSQEPRATSVTSKWSMNGLLSFTTVGRNRNFTAEVADYQLHK